MTTVALAIDSSALLARYLDHPARGVIVDAMRTDRDWCASALALPECLSLLARLVDDPNERSELARHLRDDWLRVAYVPVDELCLGRATELVEAHPLRMVDALHLAAADRLPRPVRYATFDDHQIPVALALGFDVISLAA
jgi:predicted nucleic acid-binding protein